MGAQPLTRRRVRHPLAGLLMTAVTPLWAGGLQTDDAQTLEPIQVEGEAESVGQELISANQGVVTAEQIENRPRLRTGELLEIVPGLIVTQHSGDGKANQYFLRGFNLDHGTDFRSSVDGMPVNMPTHGHGQGYSDLNFVIPELVSRIRYKKGPYFAEEGDFASAGAAQLEYFRRLEHAEVSLQVGEYGYRRLVAMNSSPLGHGELLYAVEGGLNDGPWDVPEDLRKLSGVLRYTHPLAGGELSVTGMGYDSSWDSTDQIPRRAVAQGLIGRYGSLDDSDGGDTHRYSLSAQWSSSGEQSGWRASAYWIDYQMSLYSNFTFRLDDPVNGDQFEQFDDRRIAGGDVEYERHGEFAGLHMHHRLGAQLRYDDIGTVGLYHTTERRRLSTTREDAVEELGTALYYSNQTRWTSWLRSVAGVRADFFSFNVDSNVPANSGSADDSIVSPKLSLIFGPWAETQIFVNGGYGFHSNDARGTTISVDPASYDPQNPGSADPAERVDALVRTKGYEIGSSTQWLDGVQTSLTLWQLDIDSELLFVGDAGITEPSRPSRRRGVELANYWTPLPGVIVDVDAAWSRARFTDNDPAGDFIPGAIERTASVGVVVQDWRRWFGGLRLRYFGGRPLIEDDSVRATASTLVNGRVGYAWSEHLRVAVDVLNLFDREVDDIAYDYASQLAGESGPVEDIHFHPAEPRTVRVQLTARF